MQKPVGKGWQDMFLESYHQSSNSCLNAHCVSGTERAKGHPLTTKDIDRGHAKKVTTSYAKGAGDN